MGVCHGGSPIGVSNSGGVCCSGVRPCDSICLTAITETAAMRRPNLAIFLTSPTISFSAFVFCRLMRSCGLRGARLIRRGPKV